MEIHLFKTILASFLALAATACSSQTAPLMRRDVPAVYAPSVCGPAIVAPASVAFALADPTGVEMTTGPVEYARAAISIPGGVVVCASQFVAKVGIAFGEGLQCVGGSLTPTPTPSLRYLYAPPAITLPNACAMNACQPPQRVNPCAPTAPTGPTYIPPPPPPVAPPGGLEPNIPDLRRSR